MIGQKYWHITVVALMMVFASVVPISTRAQRYCCEGESWLAWSSEHRETYVRGYIAGYYAGYFHACQVATKSSPVASGPSLEQLNKCLAGKWDFSKGIDLTKAVTAFYKRYPENRILLINEVLEELGKGKSIEEIHEHPPFPPGAR